MFIKVSFFDLVLMEGSLQNFATSNFFGGKFKSLNDECLTLLLVGLTVA